MTATCFDPESLKKPLAKPEPSTNDNAPLRVQSGGGGAGPAVLLDQAANQAQQLLLFGTHAAPREERPELGVGRAAARGVVGLMPDEDATGPGVRLSAEAARQGDFISSQCSRRGNRCTVRRSAYFSTTMPKVLSAMCTAAWLALVAQCASSAASGRVPMSPPSLPATRPAGASTVAGMSSDGASGIGPRIRRRARPGFSAH